VKFLVVRIACAALALALLPLGARSATVSYAPPARSMPAGRYHGLPYDAILPSGRLVTPAGTSIVTGMNSLGVVLSPDGRYAIASNDDEREAPARSALDPDASGGYSLTVIDTARMVAVTHYRAPGETFFSGLAAVRDARDPAQTLLFAAGGASNAVYVFGLDQAGRLTPDARHTIAIPGPPDAAFADRGISFPSTLLASADGRRVYVVSAGGESVATIDVATRRLLAAPRRVGYAPYGMAIAGSRLLVTNEGLMRYGLLPAIMPSPEFDRPPSDPQNASSLSLLTLDANGALAGPADALPMDGAPDGLRLVGGAHPTAIVTTADGAYAFVAMTNVDRIATVALGATPHVAGGTELRLFDRGPYGTQPTALALSHDASRLYVALSGLNAIAVIDARDPLHLHRLGLIPTGWAPSALALSADDRSLYVTNQKGLGHDADYVGNPAAGADAGAVWSTLQRIELAGVKLADTTRAALGATRNVVAMPPALPHVLHNVVLIVEGDQNYDEVLGDLGSGPGAPSFTLFGAAATPNLHALAHRFGVAGNMFAEAGENAQDILAGGVASAYTERMSGVRDARRPLGFASEDPEDAPRLGTVFHELARHNLSFRDYGGFLDVSGTTPAGYSQNVPAPSVLAGRVDLNYPAWSSRLPDALRAAEFVRDFGALSAAHRQPRFTYVALPAGADGPQGMPSEAAIAEEDRALGTIVDFLSHLPSWRTTVVFVVPAGARMGRDHIDASRTFALVVSPFVKHGFIGMRHLSTASVLKTVDRLFAFPPLSLGDLLADDMGDFFADRPDLRPYVAAPAPGPVPGG
jgi:DNA-binding beta-propeller fold protein YncE